jgi:hypothetical protein
MDDEQKRLELIEAEVARLRQFIGELYTMLASADERDFVIECGGFYLQRSHSNDSGYSLGGIKIAARLSLFQAERLATRVKNGNGVQGKAMGIKAAINEVIKSQEWLIDEFTKAKKTGAP